jgi:pilus assembly protein CpaB
VQKQRLIFLIVGIVLGLVAIVMVRSYIQQQDEETKKQAARTLEKMRQNQAVVLVARQDIPVNASITGSMLESSIVPREYVQPQAATSLDSVSGMITVAPISRGEQISLTKLTSGAQVSKRRDLASITPVGKRAVSVKIENIADVVKLIKPGDNIDLIAVLPMPKTGPDGKKIAQQTIVPAFQNVLLLAVGQETDPNLPTSSKGQDRDKIDQVTVALAPTEANILTFLQDQGKIRISLRSASDTQVEEVEPITWDSVLEHIPALKPEEKHEETIDIYRGLNKEKIVVSK